MRAPSRRFGRAGTLVACPSPQIARAPTHRVTLALLKTAGIALALMQTLVIPALPFFQREFDASASAVTWLVTSSW